MQAKAQPLIPLAAFDHPMVSSPIGDEQCKWPRHRGRRAQPAATKGPARVCQQQPLSCSLPCSSHAAGLFKGLLEPSHSIHVTELPVAKKSPRQVPMVRNPLRFQQRIPAVLVTHQSQVELHGIETPAAGRLKAKCWQKEAGRAFKPRQSLPHITGIGQHGRQGTRHWA